LIHVEAANPEYSALTRDVDLMVRRQELEHIKEVAAARGCVSVSFRHVAGVDMLTSAESTHARDSVHLIFSQEKVRTGYLTATPAIDPENKHILGKDVMVIRVRLGTLSK
jgi:hypothetical protein